jgi:hypothetical protein
MEVRTFCWLGVVAMLAISVPAAADITIADTGENKLDFYGFLKLDATFQDDDMNSLIAPRYANDVGTPDGNTTGFTAMHSRFGLKWAGPEVKTGLTINGCLEWDLFDGDAGHRNQMEFRTRLAYLELRSKDYSVIAGQHWDIFAAGGPTTTLTNGYYWQTGNVGFRRAQVRYTRNFPTGNLAVSLNDPTTDAGLESGLPIIEARYAWTPPKGHLALSAAYGAEDTGADDVPVFGVAVDGTVRFNDQFSLMGELYTGENLDVFLSRSGITGDEGQDVMGGFVEVVYTVPTRPVTLYAGIAVENLTDDDQIAAGGLENTAAYFVGCTYGLGRGVSIGGEITGFNSEYTGGADDRDALQLNMTVMYSF